MQLKLQHNTLMRLMSGSALLVFFPLLVFLVLWLFTNEMVGIAGATAVILMSVYGFSQGWRHIVVKTAVCKSELLPQEFDGFRILQLSDIHIGTYLRNRTFVAKLAEKVNEQNADMVVFTGDLVNVSAEEVIPFQHQLGLIKAPYGVYSVMGNHDYCEYGADKSDSNISRNQNVLKYLENKIGWRLLLNEHIKITHNDSDAFIYLVGVENISRPPFPDYGDLNNAMKGLEKGTFKVLLSHDPSHWRRGVLHGTDIALTLSGHTHAGQIKIGKFSPAKWAYREWGGKYKEGKSMLYVSLGVGGTVPFRIGAWPEINVIELKRG